MNTIQKWILKVKTEYIKKGVDVVSMNTIQKWILKELLGAVRGNKTLIVSMNTIQKWILKDGRVQSLVHCIGVSMNTIQKWILKVEIVHVRQCVRHQFQ